MSANVYAIRQVSTGVVYVGSSQTVKTRFSTHRPALRKGNHHSSLLQAAWSETGESDFVFEILEAVGDYRSLHEREGYWMRSFGETFNALPAPRVPPSRKANPKTAAEKKRRERANYRALGLVNLGEIWVRPERHRIITRYLKRIRKYIAKLHKEQQA